MKTRYLWYGGDWVPASQFKRQERRGPMIIGDIQPYQSTHTGEWITSRSRHRDHLRETGCIEGGNELAAHLATARPQQRDLRREIKEDVIGAVQKVNNGYRPGEGQPLAHPDVLPENSRMVT